MHNLIDAKHLLHGLIFALVLIKLYLIDRKITVLENTFCKQKKVP